jgi:hypothetical protein
MRSVADISSKVRVLRGERTAKDEAMEDVYAIRDGRIQDVFPGLFSDDFPAPVMANFIDTAARDVAESLAPLPSFNCGAANMVSDAARNRADKRTKIASNYIDFNKVSRNMFTGADYFATYGFMPVLIEPDFDEKMPRIVFENPRGSYYEKNKWGRVTSYSRIFRRTIADLCALYPEVAHRLTDDKNDENSQAKLEVILYRDDDQMCMFVPERQDTTLSWAPNLLGVCPVAIAERPGVTDYNRGQYDDVMWIQVARNRFTMMAMQAAEQAVEAPYALPMDVQDVAIGPMAGLRSNTPEKIRKVGQELPQAAFAEGQMLDTEMKAGARYPGVRTGNLDASIITGQGVKALEGGYDSQIRGGQKVFEVTFTEIIELCFMTDERYWPKTEKSISGKNMEGAPYEIKYTPGKDIGGAHDCDVRYGMAAGLDPNRALVFLLQVLGGGLLSKDTVRRELPFDINVTQEEQRIQVEGLRDALVQAVAGYAQAVPMLAQQGQDPGEILGRLGAIIKGVQAGKPLEKVVEEAFAPEPQPPAPPGGPEDPLAGMMGGGGGGIDGLQASGLPQGVAPGQATMGPGGRPDLVTMLAGLNSGGGPTLNTNIKRSVPAS